MYVEAANMEHVIPKSRVVYAMMGMSEASAYSEMMRRLL